MPISNFKTYVAECSVCHVIKEFNTLKHAKHFLLSFHEEKCNYHPNTKHCPTCKFRSDKWETSGQGDFEYDLGWICYKLTELKMSHVFCRPSHSCGHWEERDVN